ncbi:MAG TPA: hypothetical protein VND15_02820 [Candidatus Acidoferrales bacterium]|nr:hypothetical protein [Candidatus Acidoferrales bacterium]
MVTISAETERGAKVAEPPKHLIRREFRPMQITIKMGNHGSCYKENHADCGMDHILGDKLRKVWTDMNISPVIITDKNIVTFNMSFKGRETNKNEVDFRLSDFFRHHTIMTMESMKIKRAKDGV